MSALLNAGLRKSLADVTRRKGRTLLVVLGILISVFGLTGINFADDAIFSAYTFTLGIRAAWPDIQDIGKGFAVQEVAGRGMGLAIMRERVDAQHGRLTITSTACGTSIEACLPLSCSRKTAGVFYE